MTLAITKSVCASLLGVSLLTVALSAAADQKIMPGSTCSARNPQSDTVVIDSTGIRASGGTRTVYCPVLRDSTTGSLFNINVGIGGDGDQVDCTLYARSFANPDGSGQWDGTSASVTPDDFAVMVMPLSGFDESTYRGYTLRCVLPNGSWVHGFQWDE